MRAIEALFVLGLIALALYTAIVSIRFVVNRVGARRVKRASWEHEATTKPDGTMVVQIKRPGSPPRIIKELPPGMDAVDFANEFHVAMEDALVEARVANRQRA